MPSGPFGSGAFGTSEYSPSPLYTTKSIIDAVLRHTGHSNPTSETNKRLVILEAIINRYALVTSARHWSWLYSQADFTFKAPYEDGTVSLAEGDGTVTGTGTLWDANLEPNCRLLVYSGTNKAFQVSDVTSDTELELDTEWVEDAVTDVSYKVVQSIYDLPSDLENIQAIAIDGRKPRLTLIGTQEMADLRARDPMAVGEPEYATLVARRAEDGVRTLEVWPAPDRAYQVHIDYGVNIIRLDDIEDNYPLVPDRYRNVLYYGALAEFYHFLSKPTSAQAAEQMFGAVFNQMRTDIQMTDSKMRFIPARAVSRKSWRPRRVSHTITSFSHED